MSRRKMVKVRSPQGRLVAVPADAAPLARALAKCNADEIVLVSMLFDAVTALDDRDDVKSAWMSDVAARMPWMLDAAAYGFLPAVRA